MRSDRRTRVLPPDKRLQTAATQLHPSRQAYSLLRLRTDEPSPVNVLNSADLAAQAPKTPPNSDHAVLCDLVRYAVSLPSAAEFLPAALQLTAASLGIERAEFLEVSADGLALKRKFYAVVGRNQDPGDYLVLDAGPGSEGRFILDSPMPVIFEERFGRAPLGLLQWFHSRGRGHGIAVPVRVGEQAYGVLAVHGLKPAQFSRRDLRFVSQAARIVSLYFQRSQSGSPSAQPPLRLASVDAFQQASDWLNARLWDQSIELKKTNAALEREVAERERVESDLQLLVEVTQSASEASDLTRMLKGCLERVCSLRGCAMGQAWLLGPGDEALECAPDAWYADGEFSELRRASVARPLARGASLPGIVWDTGKPAWAEDLSEDPNFPRWREACAARLRSAFAFPITAERRVVAVLEFFFEEPRPADGRLLGTLAHLGAHLGIVFERLQRETEVRRQRAFIDRLVRSSPEGILAFNDQCRLTVWNPGMQRIFGVSEHEALGKPVFEVLPFLGETGEDKLFGETLQGKTVTGKDRPYRLGGREGFFESYYSPIWREEGNGARRVIGGLAIVHDVTDRKRAAEALRLSEERFRSLVKDVKDYAIFMIDPQGRVISWNLGADRILGYRSEEILGKHFAVFYPKVDIEAGKPEHVLKVAAGEGRFEEEGWRLRKEGSRFRAHVVLTAVRDGDGNLRGFTKVARDVTAQREAEQKLRHSEDRLRAIIDNSPNVIFLKDTRGRYLVVNREFERAFGITQEQARGKTVEELFPPEMADTWRAIDLRVLESGAPLTYEQDFPEADGPHTCIVQRFPLRDEEGKIYALGGITTDITGRVQAERSLREISTYLLHLQDEERRRIARELHDGTAQTLTAAGLSLARLECSLPPVNSRASAALAESQELMKQAAQEIRSLSYLLHPPDLQSGGLASGLETYARGFSSRTGIRVSIETADGLNRLPQDAAVALYRVVQECLANVHRHSGSRSAAIRARMENGEVRVEVTDHGSGIPRGVLDGSGGRLGVGIPGMRGRLKQLGGKLEIRSGARGTTVLARVPVGHEKS